MKQMSRMDDTAIQLMLFLNFDTLMHNDHD